jgi:acyl-CoA thioesterase-2
MTIRGRRHTGPEGAPATTVAHDLPGLVELIPTGRNRFRAERLSPDGTHLFGGRVLAQGLRAACASVDADRAPHSLHAYFLRAGDPAQPAELEIVKERDGGSFSSRRVIVSQAGGAILSMMVSLKSAKDSPDVQCVTMPDVPPVSDLRPEPITRVAGFEICVVESPYGQTSRPTRFWVRSAAPLTGPALQSCALAYVSDLYTALDGIKYPGWRPSSSIDHAVYFHRPTRVDDWILVDYTAVSVGDGRGYYTGRLFDRRGVLVASLSQESLFRPA